MRDVNGDGDLAVANEQSPGQVSFLLKTPRRGPLPAVVRDETTWYLRSSLTGGAATTTFSYGTRPSAPMMGDWNGDGLRTPGTFEGGVSVCATPTAPGARHDVHLGDPAGYPVAVTSTAIAATTCRPPRRNLAGPARQRHHVDVRLRQGQRPGHPCR